jgi:hypothetical protein
MLKAAFVICLALFVFVPIAAQAQDGDAGAPIVLVQPGSVTVKEGDVFNVSVVIENLAVNHGMVAVQFTLTWNKTILNSLGMTEVLYHTITPQDEWDNIWKIRCTVNNTGGYAEYCCLWFDMRRAVAGGYCPVNGISGDHTLAIVTMKAVAAGSITLHFSCVKVGDMNAQSLLNIDENVYQPPYHPPDNGNSSIEPVILDPRQGGIYNYNFTFVLLLNSSYQIALPVTPSNATLLTPLNMSLLVPPIIIVPHSLQTGPATTPTKVSYSPQTAPNLGNMTGVQKQDALAITEVPIGMLAAIGGILIASPAYWRRRRKNH